MKRHSRIGWEGSPLGCLTTCRNSSRDRSRRLRQSTDRRGAPRCRPSTQYSQSTTPRPSQGRGLAAQPIGWSHGPLGFRRRRGRRGAASGTDEEERTSRRQWRDVPTSAAGPLSPAAHLGLGPRISRSWLAHSPTRALIKNLHCF